MRLRLTGDRRRRGVARDAGFILVLAVMAAGAGAWGQEAAPQKGDVPFRDIYDILRKVFHKPPKDDAGQPPLAPKKTMFDWTPFISASSSDGFGVGAGGSVAYFQGDPETTKISSVVGNVSLTTMGKLFLSLQMANFLKNNEWYIAGDNRLSLTSESTCGLGTNTVPSAGVNTKFNFFRVYDTAYRQVFKGLYVGVGFLFDAHSGIRPANAENPAWPESPFVTYSEQNDFKLTSQNSAGVSLNGLLDTRDSSISPGRGWYANGDYHFFFKGLLGGASAWQEFIGDLRTYVRLWDSGRHILAFWLYGDFVTRGTAPYFDLPATGMDTYGRTGRGYLLGRFRGEDMAYGEIEYRWTITRDGLFGMVAFLNTETLSNKQAGERLFGTFATGGGLGFRLRVNKISKTNLCADFGLGKHGSFGFYLGVQEAF